MNSVTVLYVKFILKDKTWSLKQSVVTWIFCFLSIFLSVTGGGQRNRGTESPEKRSSDEEGEGKVKASEGLTPHPCHIPDGTSCVCVTLGRMPQLETDAGQKGAVVYRYVLSLPLCLHRHTVRPTGDVPLPVSVAAWLIRMSRRRRKEGR